MGSYNWDPQTFYTLDHTQKGNVSSVGLPGSGGHILSCLLVFLMLLTPLLQWLLLVGPLHSCFSPSILFPGMTSWRWIPAGALVLLPRSPLIHSLAPVSVLFSSLSIFPAPSPPPPGKLQTLNQQP